MNIKETLRWKGLKSVEFRFLGWMLRASVVLAFVFYLVSSTQGAWVWAQAKWIRTQDAAHLATVLQDATVRDDFSWAEKWMEYRPLSETRDIIANALPYSGHLSPLFFFNISGRLERLGDSKQADLWNMIGHFRVRFDLLRCGLPDGVEKGERLLNLLNLVGGNFNRNIPDARSRVLAADVMAFDDKYPAMNDPATLCVFLSRAENVPYQPLPRDQWDSFRRGIHVSTAISTRQDKNK